MGISKRLLTLGALVLLLSPKVKGQITAEEVDSIVNRVGIEYGLTDTNNPYITASVNGQTTGTTADWSVFSNFNYSTAAGINGSISEEDEAIFNDDPKVKIWQYDLNNYNNPDQFKDSLRNFLNDSFDTTLVGINNLEETISKIGKPYPNPFIDNVNINIEGRGNVEINIYDMAGRQVKKFNSEDKSNGKYNMQMDLEDLSSGAYILQINKENGRKIHNYKIIKN